MKYAHFEIRNFKGIKSAKIDLGGKNNARVYTFVGLNEGGKTTVLEAIHSFYPDLDAGTVVGGESNTYQLLAKAVPRSHIADFTGRVSVKATIELDTNDRKALNTHLLANGLVTNVEEIPPKLSFERWVEFENGDAAGNYYDIKPRLQVKRPRQQSFHKADNEELSKIREAIYSLLPSIAYFPTFVFDFPDKIYLSERKSGKKNEFYRRLFQDILDFGGRGHSIDEHIVNRIHKEEFTSPWAQFLQAFTGGTESDQIDQVIDHAAATVTHVVYQKWNEIFGEETRRKDIAINWGLDEGLEKIGDNGVETASDKHDIYVQFKVKDGADRFPIETRSLGFRWFFSFLLFTQFRAGRNNNKPLVFLLDEPASNLHATAQQKLIESFPEIARDPHYMIYSTHSHYLINPNWLEQAYIVQNEPSASVGSVFEEATFDDASVDIKVTPYRRFVGENKGAMSYFQPIADRLQVVPSRFDVEKSAIILEGKSDYYALQYFNEQYFDGRLSFYPALGAGTLSSLISILKGWGQDIRIILDSDATGIKEKARYAETFCLDEDELTTIDSFFVGAQKIESILSAEDKRGICKAKNLQRLTKKDFLLVFQEHLANKTELSLSVETIKKVKSALSQMEKFGNKGP